MHPSRSLPRSQRASVLIVALLLCTIIGISLVSYYRLAASALTGATRSFLSLSNINLAEIGLEHAMACFYDQSTGTPSGTRLERLERLRHDRETKENRDRGSRAQLPCGGPRLCE